MTHVESFARQDLENDWLPFAPSRYSRQPAKLPPPQAHAVDDVTT